MQHHVGRKHLVRRADVIVPYLVCVEEVRAQAGDGLDAGGVQHEYFLVVRDGAFGVIQHVVDARQSQQ
jgi:hypothetical protein